MAEIDFYTNPMSRGQIARWALEESGADYAQHLLAFGAEMKDAAYLAINPMGKVPAIVHHRDGKDIIVTEAAAICAYLADAFPARNLAPQSDAERADYYRWLFFMAGPFEAAITNKAMGWTSEDPKTGGTVGYGSFDAVLAALEAKFASDRFICGDRFTMADVYVGSQIDFGRMFGTLPERPALADYAARVTDRDAYRNAKSIDNALFADMRKN